MAVARAGGVVDAVTDHGRRALGCELFDDRGLVCGELLCADVGDARLYGNRAGGAFIVPGEHSDLDTGILQQPHSLCGFGAQLVTDADEPRDLAARFNDDHGHALFRHLVSGRGECTGREPPDIPDADQDAVDEARDAVTGVFDHVHGFGCAGGGRGDRGGERVAACRFDGSRPGQQLVP